VLNDPANGMLGLDTRSSLSLYHIFLPHSNFKPINDEQQRTTLINLHMVSKRSAPPQGFGLEIRHLGLYLVVRRIARFGELFAKGFQRLQWLDARRVSDEIRQED
jgi:hypothetical protein